MSFVTHLESAIDGTRLPADRVQTMHKERPLWVRYDLAAVGRAVRPTDFAARPATMWRYRELLPVAGEGENVSLGESMTPLLKAERLGGAGGRNDRWGKDEGGRPPRGGQSRGGAVGGSQGKGPRRW